MFFSTSTRSFTSVIYVAVLALLAMLATTPSTAQADCLFQCTPISTQILFCGNVKNGFQDTMPTIGIDPQVDNCLCTQNNVGLYSSCLACQDLNNAVSNTNKFISDCKITNPNRNLVNGAFSHVGSLPSTGTYALLALAFVAVAALGY